MKNLRKGNVLVVHYSHFPVLCLGTSLPTVEEGPVHSWLQEELEVFGMLPGARLPVHNELINSRVSIQMGILHSSQAWLDVAESARAFSGTTFH